MSLSLASLQTGIAEVRALRSHFTVRRGAIPTGLEADATKAHGRACVVLLSSHWERYFYSVNEELVDWVNSLHCRLDSLPVVLLLQHSQTPVDELGRTGWDRREEKLRLFMTTDGASWTNGGTSGTLDHTQLLTWMKSPKPEDVARFYRLWGVANIFESITRQTNRRRDLYLDLRELVEKRNAIAHGDATAEALPTDVTRYLRSVEKFAASADTYLARNAARLIGASVRPW